MSVDSLRWSYDDISQNSPRVLLRDDNGQIYGYISTANKYVWIGGINVENNTIVQTCQDITAHLNSCHPIGSSNITNLTPLPNNIQSTTTIINIVNPMLWRYKSRDVPAITHYDIPCIRPLED
jgi:hypothetical protein